MKNCSKVKIAIIDTGVSLSKEYITSKVKRCYCIDDYGEFVIDDFNISDKHGHGTNCADTILKMNNNVEFYIFKVTNLYGFSNSKIIIKALEKALKLKVNIINISISFFNNDIDFAMETILEKLYYNNIITIVSVKNGISLSYPASSKYVIGVKGENIGNSLDKHLVDKNNIFIFNANPIFVLGKETTYNFFLGNSKATALCSGYISSYIMKNENKNIKDVNDFLIKTSIDEKEYTKYLDEYFENNFFDQDTKENDKYLKKVIEAIGIYSNVNPILINKDTYTFNSMTKLTYNNFNDFLDFLCKKYSVQVDKNCINLENVLTIKKLSKTVFKGEK